jgi:hypothetical protein
LPAAKCSDDEFLATVKAHGVMKAAKIIGTTVRNVNYRRRRLETKYDEPIHPPTLAYLEAKYPHRLQQELKNGTILVGSDFHIWPGQNSTALRAFKKFADDLRPNVVILNGDVLDFPLDRPARAHHVGKRP